MNSLSQAFSEIIETRRSIRKFDPTIEVSDEVMNRCLRHATLAPNSSNMQLWEFYRVKTDNVKKELAVYCLGQNAATTAKEMLVIVTRRDKFKERALFNYNKVMENKEDIEPIKVQNAAKYFGKLMPFLYGFDPFGVMTFIKVAAVSVIGLFRPTPRSVSYNDIRVVTHKSAALAAQNFMMSVTAEGFDTCPMEGFDERRVKKLLKLPRKAEVNMIISVGKRLPEGVYGPRFRVPQEDVVFIV